MEQPGLGLLCTKRLYDDQCIRVRQTEGGSSRLISIDRTDPTGYAQIIEEYTPGGNLLATFVHGFEPLYQDQSAEGVSGLAGSNQQRCVDATTPQT
jgi:hypothetical protein